MQTAEYTPLPEAQTETISNRIRLPLGLEKQIGLHTARIEVICRIAGISHIAIANDNNQRTSQNAPLIVGIGSDGSGFAAATQANLIPTSRRSSKNSSTYTEDRFKTTRWTDLQIMINIDEIEQRLSLEKQQLNEASTWAKQLNKAIKKEILEAGQENLLKLTDREKAQARYFLVAASSLAYLSQGNFIIPLVTLYLASTLPFTLGKGIFCGFEKKGSGSRFSFSAGAEYDRSIALTLFSLGKTLIKKVES